MHVGFDGVLNLCSNAATTPSVKDGTMSLLLRGFPDQTMTRNDPPATTRNGTSNEITV